MPPCPPDNTPQRRKKRRTAEQEEKRGRIAAVIDAVLDIGTAVMDFIEALF